MTTPLFDYNDFTYVDDTNVVFTRALKNGSIVVALSDTGHYFVYSVTLAPERVIALLSG